MEETSNNKKTVACKSCEKPVAKSAKKCPHCGETLKTGLFVKLLTGLIVLVTVTAFLSPSDEDQQAALTQSLTTLAQSTAADLSPSGELNAAFSVMSEYTDVQRENLEREITGTTVMWELPIYEVKKVTNNEYRVQTSGSRLVGTFVNVYTQSPEQASYIESLKEDDLIKFKGTIVGTFLRNIEIDPAILVN